jgi:hypothetical protein
MRRKCLWDLPSSLRCLRNDELNNFFSPGFSSKASLCCHRIASRSASSAMSTLEEPLGSLQFQLEEEPYVLVTATLADTAAPANTATLATAAAATAVADTCTICCEEVHVGAEGSHQLPCCSGKFHKSCLRQLKRNEDGVRVCPNCRQTISPPQVSALFPIAHASFAKACQKSYFFVALTLYIHNVACFVNRSGGSLELSCARSAASFLPPSTSGTVNLFTAAGRARHQSTFSAQLVHFLSSTRNLYP